MPLPFIFASLSGAPVSDLDANFAAVGLLGTIPCAVSGTNSLTLTPFASPASPTVTAYQNYMVFSGRASGTNTGPTTANAAGIGLLTVYKDSGSGPAILAGGEIQPNNLIQLLYDSSLNSGAGGFHLSTAPSSSAGSVTSIAAGTGLAGGTISTTGTILFASITNGR